MSQKVAVAIVHGMGTADGDFANESDPDKFTNGIARRLKSRFSQLMGEKREDVDAKLDIKAVYWAPVLHELQDQLANRLEFDKLSNPFQIRDFVWHSLADAIAYQITSANTSDRNIYHQIHAQFAATLQKLAENGGEKAPLCVIGHSLGSAIASNYIWDLQNKKFKIKIGDSPLEKGETLCLFYTLGSQIALWGLRYHDFGTPVTIPSPQLQEHYPNLRGEWINFYDRDDILGYPIKKMNDKYQKAVTVDMEVNAGNALTSWNTLSHNAYWTDNDVVEPISQALVRVWKSAYQ